MTRRRRYAAFDWQSKIEAKTIKSTWRHAMPNSASKDKLDTILTAAAASAKNNRHLALSAALEVYGRAGNIESGSALLDRYEDKFNLLKPGRAILVEALFDSSQLEKGWSLLESLGIGKVGEKPIPSGYEDAFLKAIWHTDWLNQPVATSQQLNRLARSHHKADLEVQIAERVISFSGRERQTADQESLKLVKSCLTDAVATYGNVNEDLAKAVSAAMRCDGTVPIAMEVLRPKGRGPNSNVAARAAWDHFRSKAPLTPDDSQVNLLLSIAFEGKLDYSNAVCAAAVVLMREGLTAMDRVMSDRYKGSKYERTAYRSVYAEVIRLVSEYYKPDLAKPLADRMNRANSWTGADIFLTEFEDDRNFSYAARPIARAWAREGKSVEALAYIESWPKHVQDCRPLTSAYCQVLMESLANNGKEVGDLGQEILGKLWARCLETENYWTKAVRSDPSEQNRHALYDANATRLGIIRVISDSLDAK